MHEDDEEAEHEEQRRRRSCGRPSQIVAIQQKICTPLGIAIIMLAAVKKLSPELRQPRREHVVHPQPEADEAGGDERQHHRRVAEHRPARERRR